MKAILTTRCGCTREMEIPFPPNERIVVPLRPDRMSVWFDESQPPSRVGRGLSIDARTFKLHRCDNCSPYGTAEYLEAA